VHDAKGAQRFSELRLVARARMVWQGPRYFFKRDAKRVGRPFDRQARRGRSL